MLADRLDVTPLPQTFWTDETLLRWHGYALGEELSARTLRLPGQREQMRELSVISALDLLRRRLLEPA